MSIDTEPPRVGAALQALRSSRGLSLDDLAIKHRFLDTKLGTGADGPRSSAASRGAGTTAACGWTKAAPPPSASVGTDMATGRPWQEP